MHDYLFFLLYLLVYLLYVIYVTAASRAMGKLTEIVMNKVNFLKCRVIANPLPILRKRPQVRKLIVRLIFLIFAIIWFVYRDES